MRSNLARRNPLVALLAALALSACGGGDGSEGGAADSGIAAANGTTEGEAAAPSEAGDPEAAPGAAAASPGAVIQTRNVDASPFVAELTRAEREDGVLTIEIRVRNPGTEDGYHSFDTGHGDYAKFYVTAGAQKYFILKDTEGAPLAPRYLSVSIGPGEVVTWWGKFPAPPASETEIDFVMPDVTPFEDVPISEG